MPRHEVNLLKFKMDCETCWDIKLFYCVRIDLDQGVESEQWWSQGSESYWDTKLFYCVWIDLDQGVGSEQVSSKGDESYWDIKLFYCLPIDVDQVSEHGWSQGAESRVLIL